MFFYGRLFFVEKKEVNSFGIIQAVWNDSS